MLELPRQPPARARCVRVMMPVMPFDQHSNPKYNADVPNGQKPRGVGRFGDAGAGFLQIGSKVTADVRAVVELSGRFFSRQQCAASGNGVLALEDERHAV